MNPIRIGVIDSGVHASHPHVNGVAGGIAILPDGREDDDYVDRLGHGTAVTAVIREKAPEAEVFAVKIFHDALTTRIESLIAAIDWCLRNRMDAINLSLGTQNAEHEPVLREAVGRVVERGCTLVAAGENEGVRWLPGALAGVIAVELDWECPRDEYRTYARADGRVIYRASGYPRPIPGVSPERNLKGLSFAVPNVTGLLALQRTIKEPLNIPMPQAK
jgi:subtilisin family serine protease